MSETEFNEAPLVDAVARERFRTEWDRNFAVSANAGSGKTTAISERLAALALSPDAAERLRRTAVVTYTKKAAAQIGLRAREVLMRRAREETGGGLSALDHLDRVFFGTIHSFCLKLAQTYGQTVGIHLNPTVVTDEGDAALWEEFVEQDTMDFASLDAPEIEAFLRHVPLETVFDFARQLDSATAAAFRRPIGPRPNPSTADCERLLAIVPKGSGRKNILLSQERAKAWNEAWNRGAAFLPIYEPAGSAQAVVECAEAWMAPLKRWLAEAAAVLAAELAERYRAWRFERGVQTYADQIDAAMAVLHAPVLLDRIRAEGWRIILDEAQDTDPQQFAVLVEIARPAGAVVGTWPDRGGVPPEPGHFCMVGDGQQAIYGSRADVGNFSRHLDAFRRGDGGERLEFQVTFRAPHAVIELLNATLPEAFGPAHLRNFGLPPTEGAPAPFLQIGYVPLAACPLNSAGDVCRLPLAEPARESSGVEGWLAEEARQVGRWLAEHGPAGVGARRWDEVAVLAPRNEWLVTARKAFEAAGLEVSLQTRRTRCGDNPPYAWLTGLAAVCSDPENTFEWVGVLREIFGVSDGLIAAELRERGRLAWDEPTIHPEPLAGALAAIRPFVLQANDEGKPLGSFVEDLVRVCALKEKTRRLDPSGGMSGELERLLVRATELGLTGGGPRAWLTDLLDCRAEGRPVGRSSANAINLLTSHSAKGLEWPVVIVLGLWRGIGKAPDRGLKLVRESGGEPRVFFDAASLPSETREARNRERERELARLLYVTLTRARRSLILPWAENFGGRQREHPTFAELWSADLAALPPIAPAAIVEAPVAVMLETATVALTERSVTRPAPPLPARLLPHELAHSRDFSRIARHESGLDLPLPAAAGDDAIDYGLWWHETMEFLPWNGAEAEIAAHGEGALVRAAERGFGARARNEWELLRNGSAWKDLRDPRWTRAAELAIFAPLSPDAWIDGVVDLVMHDATSNDVWIVDWKTNRRRAGEPDSALLERLVEEYRPQLDAYGRCGAQLFPGCRLKLLLYASAVGDWREMTLAER